MSDDSENIESEPNFWIFGLALVFVVIVWCVNFFALVGNESRGVYGDMFGAANSVFSGLAFAGVVYAILLQRHEVKVARAELLRTKSLLRKQQEIAENQELSSRRAAFEGTFFQMLRLFADLVSEMDLQGGPQGPVTGKDVFPIFLLRIYKRMRKGEDREDAYSKFYDSHSSELGHYFRTLYNIVKFIDSADVDNKKLYSNLVRAQLSDAEADLLAYNGLSKKGEKFKPLIERYTLLKNSRSADQVIADCLTVYQKSAFDSSWTS